MKKVYAAILIVAIFAVGLFLALSSSGVLGGSGTPAPGSLSTGDSTQALGPVKIGNQVISEGKLVPIQYVDISFNSAGVVDEVAVSEGQAVRAGDLIARLKGSDKLQASVAAAEVDLLSTQQDYDAIKNNASLASAEAQLTLVQAQKDLENAQNHRTSKDFPAGDQDAIDKARADYNLAVDQVKQIEQIYNGLYNLPDSDPNKAYALSQLAQTRQKRDTALANLNALTNKPGASEIAQADANLEIAKAKYEIAQSNWEKLKNGPDPDEIALAQSRIANAEAQLAAAKESLSDLEIHVPFAGTVVAINMKPGEYIAPGAPVATVADFSKWQVETTNLTELNVINIQTGDPATITFDALPNLEFTGKITAIKEVGQNQQGDITYTVVIQLDQYDARLRWNMTSSVAIDQSKT